MGIPPPPGEGEKRDHKGPPIYLNVALGRSAGVSVRSDSDRPDRPEGAVSHRRRWDRRWAANLTRVRFTFECAPLRLLSLFHSTFPPRRPGRVPPSLRPRPPADIRYVRSGNARLVKRCRCATRAPDTPYPRGGLP